MLKLSDKQKQRKEAFRKIGESITRRASGPTLFNPHYQIKGSAVKDRALSLRVGPAMKTLQWEPTGRKAG